MNPGKYKAYQVFYENRKYKSEIIEKDFNELPPGDVIIQVVYSSLNYKDAMSARGLPGITKSYPHVPGIDAAGYVVDGGSSPYQEGDEVLVTGYDLGVNRDGGWAQYIRVPSEWIVPLPEKLSFKESMIIGTAGFTAGLSLYELEMNQIRPDSGDIVVSGATGGVGMFAVMLLVNQKYSVYASTGKKNMHDKLRHLGAVDVISREELDDKSEKPLLSSRWAAGIDTVGGNIAATMLRSTRVNGCITTCGVVAGNKLDLTVYPFILRGVKLLGVTSALCPMELRKEIWRRFSNEWRLKNMDAIAEVTGLTRVDKYIEKLLAGTNKGRVVVDLNI